MKKNRYIGKITLKKNRRDSNLYNEEKNHFMARIQIKQDEEEMRIQKLQQEYKCGNIKAEDLSSEDYQKLVELYQKQNRELRMKLNKKKMRIRKRLNDLRMS